MKKGFILITLLISIPIVGFSQPVHWAVDSTAAWIEAVNGIRGSGNDRTHIVTVTGAVSVPPVVNENIFGNVTGITVTMEGNGSFALSSNGTLLNIGNQQTLVINDIALRGHAGNNSRLVVVNRGGTLQMKGNASISGNTAEQYTDLFRRPSVRGVGGGVLVYYGTFIMQDSASVYNNTSSHSGGGVLVGGTFIMQDNASVSGNTSLNVIAGGGGGVSAAGTFIMQDNASVTGNTATGGGGGGGGVLFRTGTFTMQDNSSISGNRSLQTASLGGGADGGGVRVAGGTLTITGNASISGNTSVRGDGGGVFVQGILVMQENTLISGNTARTGGGVHVYANVGRGTFNMLSGTIAGNYAEVGGGVYVSRGGWAGDTEGVFTKPGGTIYGNNAEVHLRNTASFRNRGSAIFFGTTIFVGPFLDSATGNWRNATAGPAMNPSTFGFWLND